MRRIIHSALAASLALAALLGFAPAQAATAVPSIKITKVVTGDNFACALRSDGQVMCWGENESGQLGTGTTNTEVHPVLVKSLRKVKDIVAGGSHACAMQIDGRLWCWGDNRWAQIGTYSQTDSLTPKGVDIHGRATAIAAMGLNTCVILKTQEITCWGAVYQTGMRCPGTCTAPGHRTDLQKVTQLFVGKSELCVRLASGVIKCEGSNFGGQLVPDREDIATMLTNFTAVANPKNLVIAAANSCALLGDRSISCWGGNAFGGLANGTTTPNRVPTTVAGLPAIKAVTADEGTFCAIGTDASLSCWGLNHRGQTGRGNTDDAFTAAAVMNLTQVSQVDTGLQTCALQVSGRVWCWGDKTKYLADLRQLVSSAEPLQVNFTPDPVTYVTARIAANKKTTLKWAATLTPRGATVTYSVRWRPAASKTWSAPISAGSSVLTKVSGMVAKKKYAIEITATNVDVSTTKVLLTTVTK